MVKYSDLINKAGTISSVVSGKTYATPEDLAKDLGIPPHQIDWTQIKEETLAPAPTPTPAPTTPIAPELGPQQAFPVTPTPTPVPQIVNYNDLVNRQGTIFNIKTGVGYKTNEKLAAALGIQLHEIDWTKISPEKPTQPPTTPVTPPAVPPVTPGVAPTPTPVSYIDIENRKGTIFNKTTGQAYTDPTQLASALGVQPNKIDWTQIMGDVSSMSSDDITSLIGLIAQAGGDFPTELLQALIPAEKTEKEIREDVFKKYDIEGLETSVFAPVTETYEDIYKRLYEDAGLADVKVELKGVQEEIDKVTADLNEATKDINDNPWLSEAGRVGQIAKVQKFANSELDRLQNKETRLLNVVDRGEERAKDTAETILGELKYEKRLTAEELNYYSKRAEADIEAELAEMEEIEIEEIARYYPEYISKLAKDKDTQIVTAGGRVLLIDKTTGNTIKDLGTAYKADTEDVDDDEAKLVDKFRTDLVAYDKQIQEGTTREQIIRLLKTRYPEIDPDDIARAVYETYPDDYVEF